MTGSVTVTTSGEAWIGMTVPTVRKMMPYSHRRATAIAIDLERAIDRMAAIIGTSIPIPDRIADPDSTSARPGRLDLPRPRTLAALCALHDDRLALLRMVHARLTPTLGEGERRHVDTMLESAETQVPAESAIPWGPVRRITRRDEPNMADDEEIRLAIMRSADAGDTAIPVLYAPAEKAPEPLADSIAIDLVLDGLLTHHGIDRGALHAELERHRAARRPGARVDLASPAARSNSLPSIAALGVHFPPGLFRLYGPNLDTLAIEIPVQGGGYDDVWLYRGGHTGRPSIRRNDGMRSTDLFSFPRRTLAEALGDARFHPAIVIRSTERTETYQGLQTVIHLHPRTTHLDPPGKDVSGRLPVHPIDPDQIPSENRIRVTLDHAIDAQRVEEMVLALEPLGPMRVRALPDGRVLVGPQARSGQMAGVTFTVDELARGERYMNKRLRSLVTRLDQDERYRRKREQADATLMLADRRALVEEQARRRERQERLERQRIADDFRELRVALGEEGFAMRRAAGHVDQLLAEMLAAIGPWRDPACYERARARLQLLPRHDLLVVAFTRLGANATYRFDRLGDHTGRPHVNGTIRILGDLADDRIAELPGMPVGELIMWRGSSGGGVIESVVRDGDQIVASVRYPVLRQPLAT